ncbi:cupin domain-containing protein [Bradyrhizobium sp. SYSU BS000235]|uniref:cupin domain-containing protein n=1 Tax=Bradyrhizobium sp. SYSU BS000235 TaxID=3411332 RepID=UPI003C769981
MILSTTEIAGTENAGPESGWLETTPGERFKIQTSSTDTGGAYLVLEVEADPRMGVPLHAHINEEEHFIVIDGTLQIAVGGETQDFPAGSSVTVGKGVPHAWCNLTDSVVRFMAIFTPGRIEGMFRAVAEKKVEDVESFAGLYGTRIIGRAMHADLNTYFKPRRKPGMFPRV